jgi:hypothetical protein
MKTVHDIVREAEDNYLNGTTKLGEYVDWSMHDTIERIDAYINSKHISGDKDSLGRDKPFFNIVSAARNIWYRATDLDRKNIRIMPDKVSNTALAFVATVLLQKWMKEARFGKFLNDWGRTLATYGSAVVKFVEKDGTLTASVIPWNRFIADPVQFDSIPRIEKFYMTPAQLRQNPSYDQDMVDQLIKAASTRKTLDNQEKDTQANFIEVYEVHGMLDTRLLEDDPDTNIPEKDVKYRQQMHVVSYVEAKADKYDDFTLYKGKEKKDPYMITHLIEEDGRTLAIGAVEYLFNAQWMANHSVKNMKDTLDLASKLIFQTADSKFVGRNVLNAIETGDIFIHKENMPLTRLANDKPDIGAMQNYLSMWQMLGQELTATPDSMRGDTPPSGTPYSTVALVTQQSNSLFEIMTENKGLAIEDMMREYILPYLTTKMDNKDEVVAILESEQISELEAMYVPSEAARRYNRKAIDMMIAGQIPQQYQADQAEAAVRKEMTALGNRRGFAPDELDEKTWQDVLRDFPLEATVEVTNETADKQAVLTTLSAVLQTIASNPLVLQDPNAKMILGAILTETGRISPMQLAATSSAPAAPQNPQQPTEALNQLPAQAA